MKFVLFWIVLFASLLGFSVWIINVGFNELCMKKITLEQVEKYNNSTNLSRTIFRLLHGLVWPTAIINFNQSCMDDIIQNGCFCESDPIGRFIEHHARCAYWTFKYPEFKEPYQSPLLDLKSHSRCIQGGIGWWSNFMSWIHSKTYDWECYNYAYTQCIKPKWDPIHHYFMDVVYKPWIKPKLDFIHDYYKYLVQDLASWEEIKYNFKHFPSFPWLEFTIVCIVVVLMYLSLMGLIYGLSYVIQKILEKIYKFVTCEKRRTTRKEMRICFI